MENTLRSIRSKFPFDGYMDISPAAYYTIGSVLEKFLTPGQKVLDFGSGPCDKTAIASSLGFKCTACDDLKDDWCKLENNTKLILDFAKLMNIEFKFNLSDALKDEYDLIMMNDVLEHLHDSPRTILNKLVGSLKPEGLLFITVPNITNLRKRLDVLRGRTNLPRYELFYWYPDPWRGPVREYTRGDLTQMTEFLGLDLVELSTVHHMLKNLNPKFVPIYKVITRFFPDLADTWLLIAKKPNGWKQNNQAGDLGGSAIYKQET